ncbi:RabGAP [Coleophoma crateriformis]|uniref:RabGAP n=1 Tax=Coleophoma crateriformis TaxID=565419 RepID=A0A3D8SAS9_9HELO|nr:RabGAP [Coleophoma crateriformis]
MANYNGSGSSSVEEGHQITRRRQPMHIGTPLSLLEGREHILRFIEHPDEIGSALDPLDDDKNSPWNTLRQDEEMRAEIFQDVERCMPEEPYFRQPETQRMMLDILFIFCKINQDVGYRQGMHELLAPILWAVEQDAIAPSNQKEKSTIISASEELLMKDVLNARYIEHDAFTLLSLVMRTAKSFYELGEPEKNTAHEAGPNRTAQGGTSPIVERSKCIHEVYLARVDPGLAKHLTDIEVLPQIFLIRWVRLLFGREFPFEELLAFWDVLFAEDPGLDLVDMVCVAMLLRIRWQLIESNYSFALMLLLKYPSPVYPNGPQTFVDDAVYLRENFNTAGGATLITKYSGKPPVVPALDSRPQTPSDQPLSPSKKLSRTRSPLQTPAKFLQQQGGVEALFQGAAKGVYQRGERLGINQAVRNAVGEVRKNMQELQVARANSMNRTASGDSRWSLDEGRSIHTSKSSAAAMSHRNRQLAQMLDDAMKGLREVSASTDGEKARYVQAMDLAIAKVDFVRVYLEDATMPLPEEVIQPASTGSITKTQNATKDEHPLTSAADSVTATLDLQAKQTTTVETLPTPIVTDGIEKDPAGQEVNDTESLIPKKTAVQALRPKAPVPTRSSIAQSSFSWMLEPDSAATSGTSPPKSPSPFLKSTKKPIAGTSREKKSFLFGDDGGDTKLRNSKLPSLLEPDEAFILGTMKGGKGKQVKREFTDQEPS